MEETSMNTKPELILQPERVERVPQYRAPVIQTSDPIMAIIERMTREPSFDLDRIKEMLAMKERFEELEAKKAFVADMAEFKKNPPQIYKNKHVNFKSERTGNRTEYDHATHSEVTMKIIARLAEHGFSHRWVTTQPNGLVCVTCIITHRLGYSESQELTAPPDTSGSKSPVQAIASTRTLLERYTLLGATGLSAADLPDADDKTEDKPIVAQDVWTGLGDAANEGEDSLRKMWEALSDITRDTIFDYYGIDWSELKDKAKSVDNSSKGIDTATNMRRIMAQQDIEEDEIAKQVYEENERMNRDETNLLNAAWGILSSAERRSWKGWFDIGKGKTNERK
jgi:hypothetical protein